MNTPTAWTAAILLALTGCGSVSPAPITSQTQTGRAISTDAAPELLEILQREQARMIESGATRVDLVAVDVPSLRLIAEAHHGARDEVEYASTLKPFTIAAAMLAGVDPAQRFDGEQGRWRTRGVTLEDHQAHPSFDAASAVAHSSNIGVAKFAEAAGPANVGAFMRRTGVAQGVEQSAWLSDGLLLSNGIGVRGAPRDLALAYAHLARGIDPSGARLLSDTQQSALHAMLERAVSEEGTGRRAAVPGVRVAGKTGTSQRSQGYGAWFVGMVSADSPDADDSPQLVIAVYAEVADGYGGSVAAPAFARVVRAWTEL